MVRLFLVSGSIDLLAISNFKFSSFDRKSPAWESVASSESVGSPSGVGSRPASLNHNSRVSKKVLFESNFCLKVLRNSWACALVAGSEKSLSIILAKLDQVGHLVAAKYSCLLLDQRVTIFDPHIYERMKAIFFFSESKEEELPMTYRSTMFRHFR